MLTSPQPQAADWRSEVDSFLGRTPQKPLIVVLGPTASGKTGFSIRLALELRKDGFLPEIVNADSRQLYRYLDIGTAKITEAEMAGVPHHLLSLLDPKEELTIATFQRLATAAIDAVHGRGGIPMLVGGSMLYISALIDGLKPVASDAALRERLGREYDADDGIALMKRLEEIDPVSAAGIPRENKTYLVRSLEIFETTGKPKSSQAEREPCPYDLLILGIDADPEALKKRIDERTAQIFAVGWIEEVRGLRDKGYAATDPALKSHGYREILAALEAGTDPRASQAGIAAQVRQYAKRQRTWWRGDERIRWIRP